MKHTLKTALVCWYHFHIAPGSGEEQVSFSATDPYMHFALSLRFFVLVPIPTNGTTIIKRFKDETPL